MQIVDRATAGFGFAPVNWPVLIAVVLCICAASASAAAEESNAVRAKVMSDTFSMFGASGQPGVAVMVLKDGQVQHELYQGLADVGAQVPIGPGSAFNIGSVSKQFTVFGILLLRDDGRLALSDDVRDYIPELPDYGHTVTLEHLARHTSGLRSQQYGGLMGAWTQTDQRSHGQMLDLIRRQPKLLFEPGSDFEYSNAGTVLLAEVITRVSGMPFPEFMRRRVYGPLGMDDTFSRGEAASIIRNQVHSYYREDGTLKIALSPSGVQGYTNVYSTPRDLARWAANFKERRVGSARALADLSSATTLPGGRQIEHRMGLYATPYRGYRQIQHTGSDRGYTSYLGWFPDIDLTIIILCNVEGIEIFPSAYQIADLYLPKADARTVSGPAGDSDQLAPVMLSRDALKAVAGRYWSDRLGDVREIQVREDVLHYVRSQSNSSPLQSLSPTRFRMLDVDDDVYISFSDVGMTFTDASGDLAFERLGEASVAAPAELQALEGLYVSEEVSAVYRISACDGELTASNAVQDHLRFARIARDLYRSNGWFFRTLRVTRDAKGRVTGFLAGNVGARDVRFVQVLSPTLPAPRFDVCQTVKPPARG